MTHIDGVIFRPATLADADALSLVAGATLLESFAGILPAEAILGHNTRNNSPEQFRKYLGAPRTLAWIAGAAEGGAPVGYAMLTAPDLPLPDLTPADIELRRIYLFSRFQGSGAGQALMDLAIAGARQALTLPATPGKPKTLKNPATPGAPQDLTLRATPGASQTLTNPATIGPPQAVTPEPNRNPDSASAPRLLLGVYGKNHRALRFYERNGFHVIGTRQFTVGQLICDDFVLARPL